MCAGVRALNSVVLGIDLSFPSLATPPQHSNV